MQHTLRLTAVRAFLSITIGDIVLQDKGGGLKSLGIPSSAHVQRLGEAPQLAHRALVSLTAGMVLLLPRSWDDLNFDIGHPPAFRSTSRVRHRAPFAAV